MNFYTIYYILPRLKIEIIKIKKQKNKTKIIVNEKKIYRFFILSF